MVHFKVILRSVQAVLGNFITNILVQRGPILGTRVQKCNKFSDAPRAHNYKLVWVEFGRQVAVWALAGSGPNKLDPFIMFNASPVLEWAWRPPDHVIRNVLQTKIWSRLKESRSLQTLACWYAYRETVSRWKRCLWSVPWCEVSTFAHQNSSAAASTDCKSITNPHVQSKCTSYWDIFFPPILFAPDLAGCKLSGESILGGF